MANIDSEKLSSILAQYKEEKSAQLSPNTVREYLYDILRFQKFSGKTIKQITKQDVTKYILHMQEKGVRDKAAHRNLMALRSIVEWLWNEDQISQKQHKGIMSLRIRQEKGSEDRKALTEEEVKLCLKHLSDPMQWMIFWLGIYYGLRRQEYVKLELSDVDLENRTLTIRQSKGNKTRRIKILKNHLRTWEKWFRIRETYDVKHEYVFFSSRGKFGANRTLEYLFQKARNLVSKATNRKIFFTSHTLRYTFATRLWLSGMDIYVISKILGHSSIKTTENYLKVEETEILARYEKGAEKIQL